MTYLKLISATTEAERIFSAWQTTDTPGQNRQEGGLSLCGTRWEAMIVG
jgi:hypothetical protein